MNGDDLIDWRLINDIAAAEERRLQQIRDFTGGGVRGKVADDLVGPTLAIPRKITSAAPYVLRQLGVDPTEDLYTETERIAEGLGDSPLAGLPGFDELHNPPAREHATDTGPGPPPRDTVNTGDFDP